MSAEEMAGLTVDGNSLERGQHVHVTAGGRDLGTGKVDDLTEDGSIVWISFIGVGRRKIFLHDDRAQYKVLPPTSGR